MCERSSLTNSQLEICDTEEKRKIHKISPVYKTRRDRPLNQMWNSHTGTDALHPNIPWFAFRKDTTYTSSRHEVTVPFRSLLPTTILRDGSHPGAVPFGPKPPIGRKTLMRCRSPSRLWLVCFAIYMWTCMMAACKAVSHRRIPRVYRA